MVEVILKEETKELLPCVCNDILNSIMTRILQLSLTHNTLVHVIREYNNCIRCGLNMEYSISHWPNGGGWNGLNEDGYGPRFRVKINGIEQPNFVYMNDVELAASWHTSPI